MMFRILAQVTMVAHFLFLVFLVIGGFLAWRWPRVWFAHLAVACWGIVIIAFPLACPLTYLENYFRDRAGQAGLDEGGFIDEYITGVVYPGDQVVTVRWIVVAVIAISWAGVLWRLLRRRRRAGEHDTDGGDDNR
ncbi:uncharacterized protein DUF2784 [Stackebrandtia endophytica]|uniref:Uncharacterized protein DUF2784 n=1 Tax=Stackebrandtia endophytica TaxID=1496996 RepID=A0A543ATQ9_9ACTN|nr:uncharacterized protein DUF2784 [Stackebrandtia endophytica]